MPGHRSTRRPKNELHPADQLRVEQLVARGYDNTRVMRDLGVTLEQAADVRVWLDEINEQPELAPCGTHAAFTRHKEHDEPVDVVCVRGEKKYQAGRRSRTRLVAARGEGVA